MTKRYNFSDITIYQRVGEAYLNLTDFTYLEENETIQIASESKYLLVYENFLNHRRVRKNEPIPYSELTSEQLQAIAGFSQNGIKVRIKSKTNSSKFLGLICAETILNTGYSKRIVIEEGTAQIQQRKQNEEKKIRMTTIVSLEVKHGLIIKE